MLFLKVGVADIHYVLCKCEYEHEMKYAFSHTLHVIRLIAICDKFDVICDDKSLKWRN
jgi:hypothetical protein